MRIKKGDTVKVIAGKEKGKIGKIKKIYPKENKVLIEKINMITKHNKPKGPQSPGGIEKKEAPLSVSNVMYFDAENGKATRIGYKFEDGKKVRFKKSDGKTIK